MLFKIGLITFESAVCLLAVLPTDMKQMKTFLFMLFFMKNFSNPFLTVLPPHLRETTCCFMSIIESGSSIMSIIRSDSSGLETYLN